MTVYERADEYAKERMKYIQEELIDSLFKEIRENFSRLKILTQTNGLSISLDIINETDNSTACAWRTVNEELKLKENK